MNINGEPPVRMIVYNQPSAGARGAAHSTPITDAGAKSPRPEIKKADIQRMVNDIRYVACQGNVSDSYIREYALVKNTVIMVMCEVQRQSITIAASRRTPVRIEEREVETPIGFICARPDDEDPSGMYIDVICSMKKGNQLLEYFSQFAKLAGARFVGLSSLPSVLAYYPRFGFEFRKSCETPAIPLNPTIPILLRDRKAAGLPMPRTSYNTYDLEPYADFMLQLHEAGLSVRKEKSCAKAKINKDELKADDCGQDGYSMKKCVLAGGKTRKTRRARRL